MAHTPIERYSALVDAKLRDTLVTANGYIFNSRYEGDPKAGSVKIPVRDTEVTVAAYSKANGASLTAGSTTYTSILIDKDYAVNELIDGYDAAAVPDNVVADRLDSAGYALALRMEKDALTELRGSATAMSSTSTLTKSTVYESIVDARTALSEAGVPAQGRFLLVTPAVYALLLKDTTNFVRATQMGDEVVRNGLVGRIAGFDVYECNQLASVSYMSAGTPASGTEGQDGYVPAVAPALTADTSIEYIAGHPDWCCRVEEWSVPIAVNDLKGSGTYIGASAVQGRKVYAHKVTKASALRIKKHA